MNLEVIHDNLLLRPITAEQRTTAGIILPSPATKKEHPEVVREGFVIRKGPGRVYIDHEADNLPVHLRDSVSGDKKVKHLPLAVNLGDIVYYLESAAVEICIGTDIYHVLQETSVLLIKRQQI